MPDTRPAIRCLHCKLNQFAGELCRRCRRPLPQPEKKDLQNANAYAPFGPILPTLKEWQICLISEALRRSGGCKKKAAKLLGVHYATVYRHLQQNESTL